MKVTNRDLEKIFDMRERRGFSVMKIAKVLGLSKSTVGWHLIKYGVEKKGAAPEPKVNKLRSYVRKDGVVIRPFSSEESLRAERMSKEGMTDSEIGRQLGRKPNVVTTHLRILARRAARAEAG